MVARDISSLLQSVSHCDVVALQLYSMLWGEGDECMGTVFKAVVEIVNKVSVAMA